VTGLDLLAPSRPVVDVPARRPGSARRSSHVDMCWPDGAPGDPAVEVVLTAAAADIVTAPDGVGRIAEQASLRTTVAPDREVRAICADPDPAGLETLVGLRAVSGWRAATRQLVPAGLLSPLGLLLDEVPIAVLLSFYAGLRAGTIGPTRGAARHMRDMCAGWATGATPMRSLDAGDWVPLPDLAPVPPPTGTDPLASEPRPPLGPGRLRRARRIDVVPGEVITVDATFRDSWCDPVDGEGVLHEYVVTAQVDRDGVLLALQAEPRVLPYGECPRAAAAPQVLVGGHIGAAARSVPEELAGVSSCTHLNDLLRSLACVPALAAAVGDDSAL
jgi:hypothetical protein